jgi:hypothetical protein
MNPTPHLSLETRREGHKAPTCGPSRAHLKLRTCSRSSRRVADRARARAAGFEWRGVGDEAGRCRRLLGCEPDRHQDTGAYRQKQNSSPVENLCQTHDSSTVKNRCCSGVLAGRYFPRDQHGHDLLLQGKTFAEPVLLNRVNARWRGVYERLSVHAKDLLAQCRIALPAPSARTQVSECSKLGLRSPGSAHYAPRRCPPCAAKP